MAGETGYPLDYKFIPWAIAIAIIIICGIAILMRNREIIKEYKSYRRFNIIIASIFFSFALIRVIFFISDVLIVLYGRTSFHTDLESFTYYIVYFMLNMLFLYFDIYFVKSKKLLYSKIMILYSIITGMIGFLFDWSSPLGRYILYSGWVVSFLILFIVFLKLFRGIRIEAFHGFSWGIFGIGIIALGSILDTIEFLGLYYNFPFLVVIPAILMGFGIITITFNSMDLFNIFLEYYSTKKICLVHKGIINGKVRFCPSCMVKYCDNCFTSVILKDNTCWACQHEFIKGETTTLVGESDSLDNEGDLRK
jgi:hypothetical protein